MLDGGRRKRITTAACVALALVLALPLEVSAHHDEVVDKLDRGTTELVSISSTGEQGNSDSGWPGARRNNCPPTRANSPYQHTASDNGRYVAFASRAANLDPADANGKAIVDIFAFDRKTRKLELISKLASGAAPQLPQLPLDTPCAADSLGSFFPAVSGNGRYVAFESNLSLTGEAVTPDATDLSPIAIFVRDLKKDTTELVSRT